MPKKLRELNNHRKDKYCRNFESEKLRCFFHETRGLTPHNFKN